MIWFWLLGPQIGTNSRRWFLTASLRRSHAGCTTWRWTNSWHGSGWNRGQVSAKATVSAWRASLEARKLGSSSIIIRMSVIRKLAGEAVDNGLLSPGLAAGISRVRSVKAIGVRTGNWLSVRQAQNLLNAPDGETLKGLRDRAILAILLGCGL